MSNEIFMFEPSNDKQKVTLKNVKLHKDDTWGYYLDVTYIIETLEDIREVNFPKLRLPIKSDSIIINRKIDDMYYIHSNVFADIGFGEQQLLTKDGSYYTVKLLKTKTKEMTLSEIEKQLGHTVKIVNQ